MICLTTNETAEDIEDVVSAITSAGHDVSMVVKTRRQLDQIDNARVKLIVSDRTSFIFPFAFLASAPPIINTHPSLLPNHRGSQPLFFCTLAGHEHGASIHLVDEGIDTGPILWQRAISYDDDETFREVHRRTRKAILAGLTRCVDLILSTESSITLEEQQAQPKLPSPAHTKQEFYQMFAKLPFGWDTKIRDARRRVFK